VVRIEQHLGEFVPPRLFGIVFALGQEWYNQQAHPLYGIRRRDDAGP